LVSSTNSTFLLRRLFRQYRPQPDSHRRQLMHCEMIICPGCRLSWNMGRDRPHSLRLDVCRLDDWRPASNLALHQRVELLLASLCLTRNIGADVEQALAHVLVVQCLVERVGELV